MAIITGTPLDDALVLTAGASLDTLTGLAGNDVILVALPGDLAAGDKSAAALATTRLCSPRNADTSVPEHARVTACES